MIGRRKMPEKAEKPPKKPKTAVQRGYAIDKHGRSMPIDPDKDRPMSRFIQNVDSTEFSNALVASGDAKYRDFLAARADPAYKSLSFSALARRFNISLQEVDDLWRNHQLHLGMIRMMNAVPDILGDVAEDARSKTTVCPRCDGTRVLVDKNTGRQRPCPVCESSGRVRVTGDKGARDLLFESIGLTGKRGPLVAIQQNFGLDAELEQVLAASQKIAQGGSVEISATSATDDSVKKED